MKYIKKTIIFFILIGLIPATIDAQPKSHGHSAKSDTTWQRLDKGLKLGIFSSPQPSGVGDSLIRVLRIDPKYYRFRLLNASAIGNGMPLTPKEWCRQNGLVAAINASMYQTDYKTSVSLMRTKTHINNSRLSKDMTLFAFDRRSLGVPLVKIIDRQCEDFEAWKKKYGTLVQSIRMISCKGKNVWKQQPRKWSTAAIGIDHHGKVLFIHVRSLYSTHDLINILKMLPLNISRAMYTEGGPEAQLFIKNGDQEYEFVGSYERTLNESNESIISWPIPNVVGISLRNASTK